MNMAAKKKARKPTAPRRTASPHGRTRKPKPGTPSVAAEAAAPHGAAVAGVLVVNMIPQSLSGETNPDSEPNLAVNPANPLQMAASAFTPNPVGPGSRGPIFVSDDGGNTWSLNAILPSEGATADITLRFGTTTNTLYVGIIPLPFTAFDAQGQPIPGLRVARSTHFLSSAPMTTVLNRRGVGIDQPYVQAATVGNGKDVVVVGDNDFNQPNNRTATFSLAGNAGTGNPSFKIIALDARSGAGTAAPSIRPTIHPDGPVYGAFLHNTTNNFPQDLRYDVVVVRDDNFGTGNPPFSDLTDPADGRAGRRVVQNRPIPFLPDPQSNDPGPLGQERIGSHLSIAVDPRPGQSATVYLAWADLVGDDQYTLHVRRSTDSGQTWSPADLLSIPHALNPALAINSDGKIGFLYQHLSGTVNFGGPLNATNRWEAHFRRSSDGVSWDDLVLATVPADRPPARDDQGRLRLPYLGDYVHLLTVGKDFYGIFSAGNIPNRANFPCGVVYQRNADFDNLRLLDVDGTTPVDISIDPFFFKVNG
jgi:hypothetical protein